MTERRSRGATWLTPAQRTALNLVAQGLTTNEIAAKLVLSPSTVKTRITECMDRLGANTRTVAVMIAAHQGLLDFALVPLPTPSQVRDTGERRWSAVNYHPFPLSDGEPVWLARYGAMTAEHATTLAGQLLAAAQHARQARR
ncbi:response regulator transcription factor [Crossiella sp. CA198]|uniref:response regulator transcription factor n=1 Tax=Crossiella sp. CA198 TaxID=3455607 RepID=UPI003F8CF444